MRTATVRSAEIRGAGCPPPTAFPRPPWTSVSVGAAAAAVAERAALGTSARVAVWPPDGLGTALAAVDAELDRLDRQASRFRADSEISRIHSSADRVHRLSAGLAEAVRVALAAARWTGGRADPTVGGALIALGYDRDFAAIRPGRRTAGPLPHPGPVPGWRSVTLDGSVLRLPPGIRLDLGATAKGLGSDRAAAAAFRACGRGGVLVSLGGDIAIAGLPPAGGWPVAVADSSDPGGAPQGQLVRLAAGALATSSVTCRQWRRGGQPMHHIIDPRTGRPAAGPWRTVSVAAASCAEANAAAAAAIVAGGDAPEWLAAAGLPARLVDHGGAVRLTGGWPESEGGPIPGPPPRRLPAPCGDGWGPGS